MKIERRNAAYPPYQFHPFSSPYNQPRMDYRGYDYAINQQQVKKTVEKQPKQKQTRHLEPFTPVETEAKAVSKQASNPVLFVPPTVNDQEVRHTKSKSHLHNDNLENEFQSKNQHESNKSKERSTTHQTERTEKKEEKEIKKSSLFDQNEKSSLPVTKLNTKKDYHRNNESSQNESSSFENEAVHKDCSRKHIALLDESSSTEGETSFLHDESSSCEDGPSLFGMPTSANNKSDLLEESSSFEESPLFEESSCFHESSSFEESSCFHESSSFEESSCFHESSSFTDHCLEPISRDPSLPIVKLPVLLAKMEIDIDVLDTFDLPCPISNVSKIDWSIHSLDCKVLLPLPNVFLKGVLIATVEYTEESKNKTASFHTIKIKIPWEKVKIVHWLLPPKLPSSHQTEYMYQGNNHMGVQFHRELTQQYAEPIHSELEKIHYIWHDELTCENGARELSIQGGVTLQIQLKQSQYIDLNKLKWV